MSSEHNAETVSVPRWALEFVLYRYERGMAWRSVTGGTAESLLRRCLDNDPIDGTRYCVCGAVAGSDHDHERRMEEGYVASQQGIADSVHDAEAGG